jgi:hypothetical protein
MEQPMCVKVVNGTQLHCTAELPDVEWLLQGFKIHSTFKVLQIPFYDLIVGMDWLEKFSPMFVHWKHKWLSLLYQGQTVVLHGCQPKIPVGTLLEVLHMSKPTIDSAQLLLFEDLSVPALILNLLKQYEYLFNTPTSLPPSRFCEHSIPLFEGARPVSIRSYRFSPQMKDEVENQVKDMLNNGIIQHSNSAFSSPALLVKKKDHSWRF